MRPLIIGIGLSLAVVLASTASGAATPISCPVGARPLLRLLEFGRYSLPGLDSEGRVSALICSDGTVFIAGTSGPPGHSLPDDGGILFGKSSKRDMAALRLQLGKASAGVARDCSFQITQGVTWADDITWYGAGTRTNRFVISTVDTSLPGCPTEQGFPLYVAIQDVLALDPESSFADSGGSPNEREITAARSRGSNLGLSSIRARLPKSGDLGFQAARGAEQGDLGVGTGPVQWVAEGREASERAIRALQSGLEGAP